MQEPMSTDVSSHAEKNNLVGVELLLELPKALSNSNKKWQLAFIKIYCSRTLLNCAKHAIVKPATTIDLNHPQDHHKDFNIDQETLNDLVKNKNQEKLQSLGGPNGLVSALKTNTRLGIKEEGDEIQAFKDVTRLILFGCTKVFIHFVVSMLQWYTLLGITFVLLVVNIRLNRQFDKPSKESSNIKFDVVRNGRRQEISISDIVVGDIVCLNIGDQLPADEVFFEGHSLHVDESSMTGESDHVEVNLNGNTFLFSGTKVANGFGRMVVTSVMMDTAWERTLCHLSGDTNEQTPLQTRLHKLTYFIDKVRVLVLFLVLLVLLIGYFMGSTKDEIPVGPMVFSAVAIILSGKLEGLELAVKLTLAYSMKRMVRDQAMVRKLFACETMGSATTICTDKTGTLTLNQMKVTDSWFGLESGKASSSLSQRVVELFHQGVAMNTSGSVFKAKSESSEYEFSGSPTEKAILSWAVKELKMDMEEVIREHEVVVRVGAFNSEKKRRGVLMKKKGEITEKNVVHWKGAAEKILAMCSKFYDGSGVVREIDEDNKTQFELIIQSMAAKSLRCIAFAYSEDKDGFMNKLKEKKLSLLGIVGIKDPCRPGVKKVVEDCQFAGVNIKMITGDNIFTARAIAVECGILTPEDETNEDAVLEGEAFRSYTQQQRLEKVERIKVMARSSPFDKLLMVKCLKELGHVVAVTGDRTNDAPALEEADIGLSMGIQGTEEAKESSDIVILDDNFASVATVLKWGRCVYNNIQKIIQFQLTNNVTALVTAIFTGEYLLNGLQLLWANLIMAAFGALALATMKPTNDLMKNKPVGRTAPLITNVMWRNLLAQAFYQISVLLVLHFGGRSIFDVTEGVMNILISNTFVLCQVFNEFNAISLEKKNVFRGLHKNRLFVGIIVATVVFQAVMVELINWFAHTGRLNRGQWGVCMAIAAGSWPIGWWVKSVPVPEKPFFSYQKLGEIASRVLDFLGILNNCFNE